ncbi:extended synaptotagmin-1-like [Osmerus eperlanus]|uniref:extended synaptotagmin-1-like n=1 Tax=Osmerus eperlanus TaxID=29151 RepID=UPI002E116413
MASSLTLGVFLLSALATVHCGTVKVWGLKGSGLNGDAAGNQPDCYVRVFCAGKDGGQTYIIDNNRNPSWNSVFTFSKVAQSGAILKLEVWDKDLKYNDHLGTCSHSISPGTHWGQCSMKKGSLSYSYSFE